MIKIIKIEDEDDGSAKVEFDCDPKTYHQIFEYGFIELLRKGIEVDEENKD
jgi:hypothetical protein